VGFDFETSPDEKYRDEDRAALDPHKAHIAGVSFSIAEGDGIYVPLAHRIGANADPAEMLSVLADFAADPGVVKVAHNLSFEAMFLYARNNVIQPPYTTPSGGTNDLKSARTFRAY
jgi:DNA polymerase-1